LKLIELLIEFVPLESFGNHQPFAFTKPPLANESLLHMVHQGRALLNQSHSGSIG
jgi:hypothetical protein